MNEPRPPSEEEVNALPAGSISRNDIRLLAGIHTASDGSGHLYDVARLDARHWLRTARAAVAGLERMPTPDEGECDFWRRSIATVERALAHDAVARNLGPDADTPPPPYVRPDGPLPLWHAPKPARGKTYSKAELSSLYSAVRECPAIAQFREEVTTFRRWLEGLMGRGFAQQDADAGSTIADALDGFWRCLGTSTFGDMAERSARTPANVNIAYARNIGERLEKGRDFLERASNAWLYDPQTDPQRVVDFCRTGHWRMGALARVILDRVHHIRLCSRPAEGVPGEYDIFAGKATIADWVRITARKKAEYNDGQRRWDEKYRETARRLDAFFATLYATGKMPHLPTLSRRLKVAFPGATVKRGIASGKPNAQLTVPGVGTYHGTPVGKERAVEGLLHVIHVYAHESVECSFVDLSVRQKVKEGVTLAQLYSPANQPKENP